MEKREVIKLAIEGQDVPYVPWACSFTSEAAQKLIKHFGQIDLDKVIGNHIVNLGNEIGYFTDLGNDRFQDPFKVIWDRSVDKDIGVVEGHILASPSLQDYQFPNPLEKRFFEGIPAKIERYKDCFRVFCIGFSLYERAWTLRGMENLMVDFIEHPDFVRQLLHAIANFNITQIIEAMKYDIDAVYFGDDWGQQTGLQMGPNIWREFLLPELKRMYSVVRNADKYVMIHSCGKVDEVFDDLIDAGVNCFNPFQPEVMDVVSLMDKYRSRLSFHGGLSTQKTLPFGSIDAVRDETLRLLDFGKNGGYIFAPAHAVEGDVPLQNMLTFIEVITSQN